MSFDPHDHFFKASYWCTEEDDRLFREWTATLPKRPDDMPYHCGPDAVNKFRIALKLTGAKSVIEIGFNLGHSAMLWLGLGVKTLVSIETSTHPLIFEAAKTVRITAGELGRFVLLNRQQPNWVDLMGEGADLIFIDGAHDLESVSADIELGRRIECPFFLFDDFDRHHGPGVQDAIARHELMLLALFPNMALCCESTGWEKRL